jgi:two-component sensor histidine kinase/ABC-type amino acid transport substrate-binding protein
MIVSMARKTMLRLLWATLLIASLSGPLAFGEAREVRVGVFQASPLVLVKDNKPDGLFIDLIEHFSRVFGWRLRYVPGTWSEQLERLKKGEIDLLPAVGYTAERTKVYEFSKNPIYIDSGVVFTSRKWTIHTIFDLEGKRVAAVDGSTFTTAFSEYVRSFGIRCSIVLTSDNIEAMRKIVSGEADAGVCIYSLGTELAKEYPVAVTPISFSPIALEFAVPKGKDGDLIESIDRLMPTLIADPASVYGRSFEKWTVGRQAIRIPTWLWAVIAIVGASGLMLALASLYLRRQVRIRTEDLRKEIKQYEETEIKLTRSLHENETLLRELYHRTKNTLQLIRSFITLEAQELSPSADIDRLVRKTNDRIDVISLVHMMLYKSQDLSRISIRAYISEMAPMVLSANEAVEGRIALDLDIEDRDLLLDMAIPIGIVLNELITNSIKHAFPDRRAGRISIRLTGNGESDLLLSYRDDGVGLPDGFELRGAKTIGMQLVANIVESQLKGRIAVSTDGGTRYDLRIPTDFYEARV